jgi:MFS family permease
MTNESDPARFLKFFRPPAPIDIRTERIFLLVGAAALFAGYDVNIYGLATTQIQASLHIPENQVGPTAAYFRVAAILALMLASSADLVGRRRLLLFTIFGQGVFTLLTAFATSYLSFLGAQFWTRVFGYAEEMLLFVVVAEEIAAKARGWANTTIIAFYFTGAGLAAAAFGAVNILPHGWRALYVIGSVPIFLVAILRQRMPETQRFAKQGEAGLKTVAILGLLKDIARQYPMRVLTVIIAASAFGFAIAPATLLAQKYMQDVYHYSPSQVSFVLIPGGLVGLSLTVAAGRLSDRLGRRPMAIATSALAGISFLLFFNHLAPWAVPVFWVLGFFGYFAADTLIAGYALEIVPTHYRATVGGLRYAIEIGVGAAALYLEGLLYDKFGGHGPAIQWLLASIPISMIAILFLPEPAGKTLEEISGG